MLKYYELLSDITIEQLNSLKEGIQKGTAHPRDAKVSFAKEMITRFHSSSAAEAAHLNFDKMFQRKEIPDDIEIVRVARPSSPISVPHFLRDIGMVSSSTEGKRMIEQGAISSNIGGGSLVRITSESLSIGDGKELIFKVGKRKFKKVLFED
jgi:tyrosyl-tRNA synthetase